MLSHVILACLHMRRKLFTCDASVFSRLTLACFPMRRMGSMFGVNAVFLTFAEFLDYIDQTIFLISRLKMKSLLACFDGIPPLCL